MKKIAGIYSMIIGVSIIALWTMLLITNQVPEINTDPYGIYFHISAEIMMSISFLTSGWLLLSKYKNSIKSFIFSSGCVVYSIINSAGYYVSNSNKFMIGIFSLILIMNLLILFKLIFESK